MDHCGWRRVDGGGSERRSFLADAAGLWLVFGPSAASRLGVRGSGFGVDGVGSWVGARRMGSPMGPRSAEWWGCPDSASPLDGGVPRDKHGESHISPTRQPEIKKSWKIRRGFCGLIFQDLLIFSNFMHFMVKYSLSTLEHPRDGLGIIRNLSDLMYEVDRAMWTVSHIAGAIQSIWRTMPHPARRSYQVISQNKSIQPYNSLHRTHMTADISSSRGIPVR